MLRLRGVTIIPLGAASLPCSCDLPEGSDAPSRCVSAEADSLPIWSCSVWGLPCLGHCCPSGALLPHHFTLTRRGGRFIFCCTGRLPALKPESRTLSGTLLYGVRTFLPGEPGRPSGPLASKIHYILSIPGTWTAVSLLAVRGCAARDRGKLLIPIVGLAETNIC